MVAVVQSADGDTFGVAPTSGNLLVAVAAGPAEDPPFGYVGSLQVTIPTSGPNGSNSEADWGDVQPYGTVYLYDGCRYRFDVSVVFRSTRVPPNNGGEHRIDLNNTDFVSGDLVPDGAGRYNVGFTGTGGNGGIDHFSVICDARNTDTGDPEKTWMSFAYTGLALHNGRTSTAEAQVYYISGPDPRFVSGPTATIDWPAGWTQRVNGLNGTTGLEVRTKTSAGAGDTTVAFGATAPDAVHVYELSDWEAVSDGTDANFTNDGTPSIPSVTPTAGRPTMLIGAVVKHPGAGPQTVTGYTAGEDTTFGADGRLTSWTKAVTLSSGSYSATASDSGDATDDGVAGHLSIVGPEPAAAPAFQLCVYEGDLTPLGCLTGIKEATVRVEYNGPGSGHFTIDKNDPSCTEANLARGNIVQVYIAEIDPDQAVAEFIIEEGDFQLISNDEEGGEELQFGGRGSLAVLARSPILNESNVGGSDWVVEEAGVWRFDDEATGYILRQIIQEGQNIVPTPLPGIDVQFGAINDSNATPWPTFDGRYEIPIGSDALTEALRLVEQGKMRIRMDPGLFFRAYQTLGGDKTGAFGTGVVRFEHGVNIASELSKQQAGARYYSHVLVKGASTYVTVAAASYPYVHWGFLDLSNVSDTGMLTEAGNAMLGFREEAQEALILAHVTPYPGDPIDEANGIYLPGQAWTANGCYWPGDLVTLHTGSGEFDFTETEQRVYAITMTMDPTGYLAPPVVELNAPFGPPPETTDDSLAGRADSSESGGGTSGPHTHSQYQQTYEKGLASGYAGLNASGVVAEDDLATGTPTDGYVLTATGTGSGAWEPAPGGVVYAGTGDLADVAATESAGAATTVPRGDHVHRLGVTTTRGDLIRRGATDNERVALGASGYRLTSDGTDAIWAPGRGGLVGFIDGGASTPATATTHCWVRAPWAGTIVEATIVADASGSAVVDIKKRAYGGGAASSICASAKPTLSTAQENTDTTLTGWTTTFAKGDIFYWVLDSVTTCKKIMTELTVIKTETS